MTKEEQRSIEMAHGGSTNEKCWICGKLRGQPPDRCPGHYFGTQDPYLTKCEAADQQRREAEAFRWLEAHRDYHYGIWGRLFVIYDKFGRVLGEEKHSECVGATLLEAVESAMAATDGGK